MINTIISDTFDKCLYWSFSVGGYVVQTKLIVSRRVKTLSNTNLAASRHIKREKAHFWLTLRHSKTPLLIPPMKLEDEHEWIFKIIHWPLKSFDSISGTKDLNGNNWQVTFAGIVLKLAQLFPVSIHFHPCL